MADQFKIGDTVKLKSGGPLMTVEQSGDYLGEPRVWCVWFAKDEKKDATFPPEALELA
jgi:uncharacterized protein YodC (DUF2158 family)